MTITIVDSGFVFAILDVDDEFHAKALSIMRDERWRFYLPTATLVEIFHLKLHRHRKHTTDAECIQSFAQGLEDIVERLPFQLEEMTPSDYRRVVGLLNQYADSGIEYVDAVVVATAERLGTPYIMTVDQRDFRRYVPSFADHFLLPMFDS